MAGAKINDYSIGDSNIQSVMLTLDKAFKGQHQVSLTNYDNTSESQIAAGSVVECNGAQFKFDSNESITGSPSDGTVYIRLVPAGDTITAEYTNTEPTWSDSKQGWYGTSTDANKRYLEFIILKDSALWQKQVMINTKNGEPYKKSYVRAAGLSPINSKMQAVSSIDILGEYNNSTYSFVPKKSGLYLVSGSVGSRLSDFGTLLVSLQENGLSFCTLGFQTSSSTYVPLFKFSELLLLDSGKSYSLYAQSNDISVAVTSYIQYLRIQDIFQ